MKLHWSIADKELEVAVEHTGHKIMFPKISVPFLSINYFMWNVEDKHSIVKRLTSIKLSEEQKLTAFVLFMILLSVL